MTAKRGTLRLVLVAIALFTFGCGGPTLVQSPNLYTQGGEHPFDDVPERFQNNRVDLIFATDRKPIEKEDEEDGETRYGFGRSQSLAIGTCTVTIGDDLPWQDLVEASITEKRKKKLPLAVVDIQELVRFPRSSTDLSEKDGKYFEATAYVEAREQARVQAMQLIEQRLETSEKKEVYVFVHGYNNDFDAAAFRMAQLWHFMGRDGVPIMYTWPAGHGGLRGYNYDRESSEFTIFHLKQFLKGIASAPGLEKIHIIAHSRGTDVAITTLRELNLEFRGTGIDIRDRLKIGSLVLAAPDLDWEVAQQRMTAEHLIIDVPDHATFYLSGEDKAIGIAGWLFGSVQRIGRLGKEDLTEEQVVAMNEWKSGEAIDVRLDTGFIGHGYFIDNPAVLSDLILLLRDGRKAGEEHGRPLHREQSGFWQLLSGYPGQMEDE